jgi:histidinol dehydrogenase
MAKKVYVVVTTVNDGERDLFADVVLVTENEVTAQDVQQALKEFIISGETKGLIKHNINPENLSTPISGWAYFTKEIDGSF